MDEGAVTMTETRVIAHLPSLDIELVRRELPDRSAEQIALRVTAKPSFEAVGAAIRQGLPAIMAMNPAFFWCDVWRQATESWFRLAAPPDAARRAAPAPSSKHG
jgi:hypothetical protein